MNPEEEQKIFEDFPNLYEARHRSMMETCMCWGLQTNGIGWELIIRKLSERLEPYCAKNPDIRASQVKEKFGMLVFDLDCPAEDRIPEFDTWIEEATQASMVTCETCGQPGKRRGRQWIYTLCNTCWSKHRRYES